MRRPPHNAQLRYPRSMAARPRVLIVTSAHVPSSAGEGVEACIDGIRGEIDVVCVKAEREPHQGRLGDARIFRVKGGDDRDLFMRAVMRQFASVRYDLVVLRGGLAGRTLGDPGN